MSVLYLDASALTKLVVHEPETDALRARVRSHRLVTSRVAVVEVLKAVARSNPDADPQPIFTLLSFVEVDADLARIAGLTGDPGLRALDALHVASALRLGPAVDAFVTYDARQAVAASAAGLKVDRPTTIGT